MSERIDKGWTRLVAAVFLRGLADMQAGDADAARFVSLNGGRYLDALGFDGGEDLIWNMWKYLLRKSYMQRFNQKIYQILEM